MVIDVERTGKGVVAVSKNDEMTGKNLAVCSSNPHRCDRGRVCLTILQVDKVEDPLRAVSQKHEDASTDFLRMTKYQCGAELMTVIIVASAKLGTDTAETLLLQRGKERFFKKQLFTRCCKSVCVSGSLI